MHVALVSYDALSGPLSPLTTSRGPHTDHGNSHCHWRRWVHS